MDELVISNLIVILSIVCAGSFWIAWQFRRDLREQIERPKHQFLDQVSQFDRQCFRSSTTETGNTTEPTELRESREPRE